MLHNSADSCAVMFKLFTGKPLLFFRGAGVSQYCHVFLAWTSSYKKGIPIKCTFSLACFSLSSSVLVRLDFNPPQTLLLPSVPPCFLNWLLSTARFARLPCSCALHFRTLIKFLKVLKTFLVSPTVAQQPEFGTSGMWGGPGGGTPSVPWQGAA